MDNFFNIFKDWGGQIMAAMGIFGGLWAYFRHDRIIKKQEKLLNDFQIKQIEKEQAKEKMAEIYYGANFGPYEVINPQSYREEKMFLCEGRPDIIDLKIIWDDEFQKDRSVLLSVPF